MEFEINILKEWLYIADMDLDKECATLNIYGIIPRYPHELVISEIKTEQALHYASEIKNFPPIARLREIK